MNKKNIDKLIPKAMEYIEKNFLKDIHQTILKVFNPQYSINQ